MTDSTKAPHKRPLPGGLRNPKLPRADEAIGGGYFVFRRGDGTGRIRPSQWPFEHPTIDAARREAERLADLYPGYRFDILSVCGSAFAEKPAAAA